MRCLGVGWALIAFALSAPAGEDQSVPVTLAKVERRDVAKWTKLTTTVIADAEVILYAKVSGYLTEFSLDIGDEVKPGQLVARIDAPDLVQDVKCAAAQLAEAKAEAQAAAAQLARVKARGEEIDATQAIRKADVLKAQADLARTETVRKRTEKLFAGNAATEQDKEYQEDSSRLLAAGVKTAESSLAEVEAERELWKKDIDVSRAAADTAQAKVEVAQAALDRAKTWLSYTDIVIPQIGTHTGRKGVVTRRFVANGDLIFGATGGRSGVQPLVAIAVTDPVRVVADIPENDSIGVARGTTVQFSFHAWPQAPLSTGKVSRTSEELSVNARTLRAEVDVPNADGKIKPGMFATEEFALAIHKGVLTVPASSVVVEKQEAWIFTVEGGRAKRIPVQAGFQDHVWTEISADSLSAGLAVIQNARVIHDGLAVRTAE